MKWVSTAASLSTMDHNRGSPWSDCLDLSSSPEALGAGP